MLRAEPALSRAPLHLPAVIGAALTTGITTPVPPSGPPPQSGGLTPEGCPAHRGLCRDNHPPATPGKAQGLTWRYGTLTATTPHTANASRTHSPKGEWRRGGLPYGLRGSLCTLQLFRSAYAS